MKQNNNQWVYYNGELYHAGVKGMQWGKHLPGTDWWKTTTQQYYNQGNSNTTRVKDVDERGRVTFRDRNTPNFIQRVKGNLYTAGQAAKIYGNKIRAATASARVNVKQFGKSVSNKVGYRIHQARKGVSKFWNNAKGYSTDKINKLKDSARNAYSSVRTEAQNILNKYYDNSFTKPGSKKPIITGKSGDNELYSYVTKEYKEAIESYNQKLADGPIGKQLNSFIQIAQYNVISGCARWLDSIGMDDEVASFLKKLNIKSK